MKLSVALLLGLTLQYVRATSQPSAFTQSRCLTAYTSKSVIPSRTTTAYTLTFYQSVVYTVTPSKVLTPPSTTTTSVITISSTTTLPVPVSTTTITEEGTVTVTNTVATEFTETVEGPDAEPTYSTSYIPVPDGFQYPSPTPGAPQKRENHLLPLGGALIQGRTTPTQKSPHCSGSPLKYPSKITCYKIVETFIPTTITKIAKTTTVKYAPTPTVIVSRTTTVTITKDASTIITESTTIGSTQTVTETSVIITGTTTSTTIMQFTGTIISYAACTTAANVVSQDYKGRPLQLINSGGDAQFDYYTTDTYSCCVACFQNPNCYGANYGEQFGAISCELALGNSCPAAQGGFAGDYTNSDGAGWSMTSLTFSNGPCGRYKYAET